MIPVLAVLMYACNSPRSSKNTETEALEQETPAAESDEYSVTLKYESDDAADKEAVPFSLIEQKPVFNGEDDNAFAVWVNSHLKYPEQALKDQAQGRVLIQFTIGADGEVRDAKVLRGVREDLDAEALRVVASSPKWKPGYNADGMAVPVTYSIPIVYKLK